MFYSTVDFRRITFGVIGIEHNNVPGRKQYIINLMNKAGYIQHQVCLCIIKMSQ